MKKLALLMMLSALAWGQFHWPDQATVVRIQGETVSVIWRDGKPFVERDKTIHLLHIRTGPHEIDLAQALQSQGFTVRENSDGSIDCERPPKAVASDPQAWGHGSTPGRALSPASGRHHRLKSPAGIHSDSREELIQSIGEELARHARRPIRWTFTLVEDDVPNAWTPGEGRVSITTGLLDLDLSPDEIAGVLGHEIAHGVRQHLAADDLQRARERKASQDLKAAARRWEQAKAEYANHTSDDPHSYQAVEAKSRLEWERSRVRGQLRQVERQQKFNESYRHHETCFNHTQEKEADAFGIGYAIAAGYRADGLLTALMKIRDHGVQNYGQRALSGNKTHPPLPERIQRLQEVMRLKGY